MNNAKFKILYNAVKPSSLEDTVDDLWLAIITLYFPQLEFIIKHNARPANSSKDKKRADFIIQSIVGANDTQHVVLVEDKRASKETSQTAWEEAVGQLTDYMIQARKADQKRMNTTSPLPYDMYGIVNVGRHSHFYVLKPTDETLTNLPSGGGKALHVKNDETKIAAILNEIVSKTIVHGLSSSSSSSSSSSAASSRHSSPGPSSQPGASNAAKKPAAPAAAAAKKPTKKTTN
jgi:hypothetical protein